MRRVNDLLVTFPKEKPTKRGCSTFLCGSPVSFWDNIGFLLRDFGNGFCEEILDHLAVPVRIGHQVDGAAN